MNISVVANVLDVRHSDEEVYLSCFNSEVERSIPAMTLPLHSGKHSEPWAFFLIFLPYSEVGNTGVLPGFNPNH